MKKDKIFLSALEKELLNLHVKKDDINEILNKYNDLIISEKKNNKRIKTIIKSLGDPLEIALKEASVLNYKEKNSHVIEDVFKITKKYFKIIYNACCKFLSNLFSFIKKVISNFGKKIRKLYKLLSKDLTKDIKINVFDKKKNKFGIFKKKEKLNLFDFDSYNDDKKVINEKIKKVKVKKEKNNRKKDKVDNIVDDIKNDIVEETVIVNKVIVNKLPTRVFIFRFVLLLFVGILCIVVSSLSVASLFSILDGIRIFGISIALIPLSIISFYFTIVVYRLLLCKTTSKLLSFAVCAVSIFTCIFGVCLTLHEFYNIETVDDVSEKYSFTSKYDIYNIPENRKLYLIFNSNYKTQYIINYDKTIKDKVRVNVQYYECYYDYYFKKNSNSIYFSLKYDVKDRISTYIDDLKENKIYNNDELSRYIVTISVNEKDYERLVIQN